jgi:hypothetical protein
MKTKTKPTKEWQEKALAKGRGDGAPVVTEDNYRVSLMQALGYYNLNMDNSQRAKTVLAYIKKTNKKYYDVLSKAPDYEFLSLGSLITILNKGEYLSAKDQKGIQDKIDSLYECYSYVKPKDDDKPKAPVISIEQRVIDMARSQSELIDYAIDNFVKTKVWNFNTKAHLLSNNISGMVAKKIGEYYKNTLDEIEEAIKGEDEQLVEGYSFLSKAELKKFRDAIKSIVDDCAQHQVTVKKPRVTKAKPPAIIVKKLKYMFKHDLLNLKSVNPADIVGAKELWCYNIKYRKLVAYVADDSATLSVKGTTIINYSIAKSWSWTLRNPEKFFKDLSISKRNLATASKALTTKPTAPNGRVNEETILLGAF